MLENKKIILGITGSIAAYKSAMLVRLLVKAGAEVRVIQTPKAAEFVGPLTFSTLSKNPVVIDLFDKKEGTWNQHVEWGLWADALVIAPATANTIAKCANGFCDNFLNAVYLSARCPVFFAPAMDVDMYKHASTEKNLQGLASFPNHYVLPSGTGELASGLHGEGRMAEPEEIADVLNRFFTIQHSLKGKRALVTAGPTYEKIDPVRFIGNFSSGKMGFKLAEELAKRGAEVELISGPSTLKLHHSSINRTNITSANEMYKAVMERSEGADIIFMAAAVADYTVSNPSEQKVKKGEHENLVLNIVPTQDILLELGKRKRKDQLLVGFALETENELENARKKLERKNADFIVLNSLNDKGSGFGTDTNKITIIGKNNLVKSFELQTKEKVAIDIIESCLPEK